jgi:hypothetical protein
MGESRGNGNKKFKNASDVVKADNNMALQINKGSIQRREGQ